MCTRNPGSASGWGRGPNLEPWSFFLLPLASSTWPSFLQSLLPPEVIPPALSPQRTLASSRVCKWEQKGSRHAPRRGSALGPRTRPQSPGWGQSCWPFQTVCEITSCGHRPPNYPGLALMVKPTTTTTTEFLKGPRKATEGSFITGPHTWAQVILNE